MRLAKEGRLKSEDLHNHVFKILKSLPLNIKITERPLFTP